MDIARSLELNKHFEEREAMKTTKRNSSRFLKLTCAIAAAVAGMTASTQAQTLFPGEELGRPVENLFSGLTTYTEKQGNVEMSITGSHERDADLRNSSITSRVEYGITNGLEGHVQLPFDIADRSSGMTAQKGASRVEAGLKYSVIESNSPVALSIGGDIEVPLSGSNDVSGKMPKAGPLFMPSLMIAGGGESMVVQGSAQAELGAPQRAINYSVGSLWSLGAVTPSLELSSRAQEQSQPEFYATPGVTYSFNGNTELGVGTAIGLNKAADDVRLMARLSVGIR